MMLESAFAPTTRLTCKYISLKLDDPSLAHPSFASLFPGDDADAYNLPPVPPV